MCIIFLCFRNISRLYFQSQHNEHHIIFLVIQNASDQKTEMERIKGKMAQEVSKIEERKAKIDDELKEVQASSLIDLCSQYAIICHLLYLFHTSHPSCTYSFFISVSLPLLTIAAL